MFLGLISELIVITYASIHTHEAIAHNNHQKLVTWSKFWVLYCCLTLIESLIPLKFLIPLYGFLRLVFCFYILFNRSEIYDRLCQNWLTKVTTTHFITPLKQRSLNSNGIEPTQTNTNAGPITSIMNNLKHNTESTYTNVSNMVQSRAMDIRNTLEKWDVKKYSDAFNDFSEWVNNVHNSGVFFQPVFETAAQPSVTLMDYTRDYTDGTNSGEVPDEAHAEVSEKTHEEIREETSDETCKNKSKNDTHILSNRKPKQHRLIDVDVQDDYVFII